MLKKKKRIKERKKITWNPLPCQIRKRCHIIMFVSNLPWSPSVSPGEQLSFLREIIVYVVACGYIMEKKNFLKRFTFPLRLGKCFIGKEDRERILWYKKCSESWYLWGLEPYWELPCQDISCFSVCTALSLTLPALSLNYLDINF